MNYKKYVDYLGKTLCDGNKDETERHTDIQTDIQRYN